MGALGVWVGWGIGRRGFSLWGLVSGLREVWGSARTYDVKRFTDTLSKVNGSELRSRSSPSFLLARRRLTDIRNHARPRVLSRNVLGDLARDIDMFRRDVRLGNRVE